MNQLRAAKFATLPRTLLLIWLPCTSEPVLVPLAFSPNPPLKMIVLPTPAAGPPSVIPRAAVSVTPLPRLEENELPEITVPV